MFRPTPGYRFVAADLSQVELRVVAWMAAEPTMLAIFRAGGDIHSSTAAAVMGITDEAFAALPKEVRDQKRYEAKSALRPICSCKLRRFRGLGPQNE